MDDAIYLAYPTSRFVKNNPICLTGFFFFFLRGGVDSLDELQLKLYLKNNKSIKKIRSELDVRESVLLQN